MAHREEKPFDPNSLSPREKKFARNAILASVLGGGLLGIAGAGVVIAGGVILATTAAAPVLVGLGAGVAAFSAFQGIRGLASLKKAYNKLDAVFKSDDIDGELKKLKTPLVPSKLDKIVTNPLVGITIGAASLVTAVAIFPVAAPISVIVGIGGGLGVLSSTVSGVKKLGGLFSRKKGKSAPTTGTVLPPVTPQAQPATEPKISGLSAKEPFTEASNNNVPAEKPEAAKKPAQAPKQNKG